ncbi:MAG: sterol desaturase family protein [Albidovulum sp.]
MDRLRLMLSHRSILGVCAGIVIGVVLLVQAETAWLWALVILGIPAQMLNEYNLHRFIFHLPPPRQQWQFDLMYRAHYGHHDFPTNPHLFFAPDFVVFPVAAFNFTVIWAVLSSLGLDWGLPGAAAVVLVGGGATFLAYEWFHTTAHLPVPKTAVERHVTTLHNQHHFRDFSKWFHVTAGGEVIDRFMGTAIDRDALKFQQRIEFIRTLGMRPDDQRLIAARQRFAGRYGLSPDEIARAARV